MISYIIDGNNLIGKIPSLFKLQKKDKQASREKLIPMLDRFFAKQKCSITLHFDGYESSKLGSSKIKIIYSQNLSADEKIKNQVSSLKSTRTTTIVTSDSNLAQFARVCGCKITSSEEFAKGLKNTSCSDDEESIIKSIDDKNEFKRLFGVD